MNRIEQLVLVCLMALSIGVTLPSCGGASAQSATPSSSMCEGGACDGYNGGINQTRDVRNAVGGIHGNVNTTINAHTLTGPGGLANEWSILGNLENWSGPTAEQVGIYGRCTVMANGQCFGMVAEAGDLTGQATGVIPMEVDSWITGPTNGSRPGMQILNGDIRFIRGLGRTLGPVESDYALTIGQTVTTPWATWLGGLLIQGNIRESGIKMIDPVFHQVIFEVRADGSVYSQGRKL